MICTNEDSGTRFSFLYRDAVWITLIECQNLERNKTQTLEIAPAFCCVEKSFFHTSSTHQNKGTSSEVSRELLKIIDRNTTLLSFSTGSLQKQSTTVGANVFYSHLSEKKVSLHLVELHY